MDDNTMVGLLGEAFLAETPARRRAGRLILEFARIGRLDRLLAAGDQPLCGPAVAVEIDRLAERFGLNAASARPVH